MFFLQFYVDINSSLLIQNLQQCPYMHGRRNTSTSGIVNKLLFAMILFRNLQEINQFAMTIFCDFIHTHFDIPPIQQRLICGVKYSRRRDSRKSCEYFSDANKSWFTVYKISNLTIFSCTYNTFEVSLEIIIIAYLMGSVIRLIA